MERPSLKITFGETEIKMTYGLNQDLMRIVPSVEDAVSAVLTDIVTRDFLVRRALTKTNKPVVNETDLIPMDEIELDPDQIADLIEWILGHLLYFFTRVASSTARQAEAFKQAVPQSTPSANGSAS